MFRRKRSSSNPPRPSTSGASAAATTAASQAFLANRASNANLSNAAAAAALRSYTTTPTQVSQISTKRMQRRGSVGSQGSASGSAPVRPGLQRQNSSGSMTERSFREPAPNRPASSHGPYPRYDPEIAPPVPALPKDIPQTAALRAASVEPQQRVKSPMPPAHGKREVSLDRGPGVLPDKIGSKIGSVRAKRSPEVPPQPESPGNRASVNFSRPMSPLNGISTAPRTSSSLASRPVDPLGLSSMEASNISRSLSKTADKPVKKKKKATPAEGSHLASSVSNASLQDSSPPTQTRTSNNDSLTAASLAVVKKKKNKEVANAAQTPSALGDASSAYSSDNESVMSDRSALSDRSKAATSRASGVLAKQPSIVREDREGEELAEKRVAKNVGGGPSSNGAAVGQTPANISKVVSKDKTPIKQASQPQTPKTPNAPTSDPASSLTPARAAHFSSQPEYAGLAATKHQPPGRSVSPAKSALKHSPSRGHSPVVIRGNLAPSEASDTASQVSDDGATVSRRKKNVRVSFDEESVLIGRAASPPQTSSPIIQSPQAKAKSRSWFDLVRDKKRLDSESEDEDGVIKPRPALPSFGSVRGQGSTPPKSASANTQTQSSPDRDGLRQLHSSTDAGIGSVLASEASAKGLPVESKPATHPQREEPLPPEVTSVEGTGDHSDVDSEADVRPETGAAFNSAGGGLSASTISAATEMITGRHAPTAGDAPRNADVDVPAIAVEPATPNMDVAVANRRSWLGMPGDFPSAQEAESGQETVFASETGRTTPVVNPATVGIAEPESEGVAAQHDANLPAVGLVAEGLRHQIAFDEEEEANDASSESSVYSDAEENQSDAEGDGFGSINAIVESPVPSPGLPTTHRSPPASPSVRPAKEPASQVTNGAKKNLGQVQPASEEDWDQAGSYWANISEARKQQLERAAMPGAIDEPVLKDKTMRGSNALSKKKKKTKPRTVPLESSQPPAPGPLAPTTRAAQVAARQNSNAVPSGGSLSPTLRNNDPKIGTKAKANRASAITPATTQPAVPKRVRPVSELPPVDYQKPSAASKAAHARAVSATDAGPRAGVGSSKTMKKASTPAVPKLQRADSDSESSFKKSRAKKGDSNKYQMKRSMRSDAGDSQSLRPSSISIRSASPAGSTTRRPFSTIGSGSLRSSMRDSTEISKPARTSLRAPKETAKPNRTKSPSRFGFGKSKPNTIPEGKATSRFSSRFGDSSDEDEGFSNAVRSRFADSSSDDEPTLAPVRGIPRRIDEGDSTDLEDSSGNEAGKKSAASKSATAPAPTTAGPPAQGAALATGSLRAPPSAPPPPTGLGTDFQNKKAAEKEKKKRSFFGTLKRRDPTPKGTDRTISSPRPNVPAVPVTGSPAVAQIPASPAATPAAPLLNSYFQSAVANSNLTGTAASSPKSPKLQRRTTPKKLLTNRDISWPLPQAEENSNVAAESRPRTSDGGPPPTQQARPSLVLRQDTTQGEAVVTQAKKKTPFWKKVFGSSK